MVSCRPSAEARPSNAGVAQAEALPGILARQVSRRLALLRKADSQVCYIGIAKERGWQERCLALERPAFEAAHCQTNGRSSVQTALQASALRSGIRSWTDLADLNALHRYLKHFMGDGDQQSTLG